MSISMAISLQFYNPNFDNLFNTMSFLTMMLVLGYYLAYGIYAFKTVN
jgi:hypothetical protein